MIQEHYFNRREQMFDVLQQSIIADLSVTLASEQKALLLASGGSSPAPVYEALSSQPLDWQNISVALVDERWVDRAHAGSNEALIDQCFNQNHSAAASITGMKTSATTAVDGWSEVEKRYQVLPWDGAVALLGMGPDGHTASLFPESEGLDHALTTSNLVAPITAIQSSVTGELTERISLSLSALAQCKSLYLLITGDEKKRVYERAKQDAQTSGRHPLVISHLLARSDIHLQVFWAP